MPFVIRSTTETFIDDRGEGGEYKQYLRVVRTSTRDNKRRWVDTVEQATVWATAAHAKAAFLCAVENKDIKNDEVEIVELALAPIRVADVVKVTTNTKRKGYGRRRVTSRVPDGYEPLNDAIGRGTTFKQKSA